MITLPQIKAARALLGWTQDALADAAGISLPSINNMERGLYSPRPETHRAIVTALEKAGIEFTENNGLRQRQEHHDIITFTGPNFIRDLDEDIMTVLHKPEDEIVGSTYDDRKWIEYAGVTNPAYVEARTRIKWKERFLIPATASFITSPPKSYRTLPEPVFGKMNYEIYGNRLALIEWEAMRVTMIKNHMVAETFKKQFNALWSIARPFSAAQLKKIEQLRLKKKS
ncbi:MAG: helix-turn-helix transcriptional regulator [Alphaproteobacteria bacterium]